MKLVICTKLQVNQMNCVESRRGGGVRLTPPSLKASCNYFFFEVKKNCDLTILQVIATVRSSGVSNIKAEQQRS